MKIISGILGLVILALVLCFALPNGQQVTVGYSPFEGTMLLPLYMVGLLPLLIGLLVGGTWGWLCGVSHRIRAHRLSKEVDALKRRLESLAKEVVDEIHPVTRKAFWKIKR